MNRYARALLFLHAALLLLLLPAGGALAQGSAGPASGPAVEPANQPAAATSPAQQAVSSGPIYVIPIEGEINRPLMVFLRRGIEEAKKAKARSIVFAIDTFGGRVDSALQITTLIGSAHPIQTVAYVPASPASTGVSWSAGALISFSCDRIYMAPGTSMGAATPVYQTAQGTETAPEKAVSAVRAQMASLAEKNGYPPGVALAMVDPDVELREVYLGGKLTVATDGEMPDLKRRAAREGLRLEEGRVISPKGKLLTLTAGEAQRYGVSTRTVASLEELTTLLGAGEVRELSTTLADRIVSALTGPAVIGLLVLIGLVALYIEITTPGFGVPGTIAIICFATIFGSNALLGTVGSLELILFLVGVAMLVVEIFLIPGFGVVGITGIVLMVLALVLSQQPFTWPRASWQWGIFLRNLRNIGLAFVGSLVAVFVLARFFPAIRPFRRLILGSSEEAKEGYSVQAPQEAAELVGKRGRAVTNLRPAGKAEFDGEVLAVESDGEYVEAGSPVRIVEAAGNRIVVRKG
jgi:membrane-bound serine protease (ClpP class)